MDSSSSSSDISDQEEVIEDTRPTRNKQVPIKLKEGVGGGGLGPSDPNRLVIVKCCQTGKQYTVKLDALSNQNGLDAVSEASLHKDACLLMEYGKKSYPVQFLRFKDKKRTRTKLEEEVAVLVKAKGDAQKTGKGTADIEEDPPPKRQKKQHKEPAKATSEKTFLDNSDKDLLIDLSKRMERMEGTLTVIMEMLERKIKKEDDGGLEAADDVIPAHVMHVPSRDAYSFGLQLMDFLFTREELASSLLFKSKKSTKPPLDQGKVERLLSCIRKRYGEQWDLKLFTQKANQKCRDSRPDSRASLSTSVSQDSSPSTSADAEKNGKKSEEEPED